jgi:SulP family sulfate permease
MKSASSRWLSWRGRIAWQRVLPFLTWRSRVTRDSLRSDFSAGLTGGLILLPQGVAFASIAGMPPEYGLYAAMVPAIVAALFGSSWQLVSGPTTAISIVVFASLSPMAEPGSPEFVQLALTLSFLSGVLMLALGALRLGGLMNFVSHTVIVGFTAGAAVLIASSQVKYFFGLHIPRGANFPNVISHFFTHLDEVNPWVISVSMLTLLGSLLARIYVPRVPHMLLALLAGSALAALLNFAFGVDRTGIGTLAAIPRGLPPLSAPDLSADSIRLVLPVAIALAILSLTEAMSIARALATRTEQRVDNNQEFIGQGLSNIVGAFFSAYPSSGSFNRSGLNLESGARTPLAAVFASLILVVIVQFVAPLAAYLPLAAMAGLLFLVAWGLVDIPHVLGILRSNRQEGVVLATTFLATLFLNLEFAIYVGVLLSLLLYLNRTSRPVMSDVKPSPHEHHYHFTADSGLPDCPQLKILSLNGSVFFGAVDHVQQVITNVDARNPTQKFLMLGCPGVNFIDLAGGQLLAQEARRRRRLGGDLFIFNMRNAPREALKRDGHEAVIGADHFIPLGVSDPIGEIFDRLDRKVCASCTRRIFRQCAQLPPPVTPAP